MDKKSKKRRSSPTSLSSSVNADSTDGMYDFPSESETATTIQLILQEARAQCPEAEECYPLTRALFDEDIWPEIQTYWLPESASSSLDPEIVWTLLKGVRLESFRTNPMQQTEEDNAVEDAQVLELLWSVPKEDGIGRYRSPEHWRIDWYDLVPGYRQTLFGAFIARPFFEDAGDDFNLTPRPGWGLQEDRTFEASLESARKVAGLSQTDIGCIDMPRCLIPAIGILVKHHPGNKGNQMLQAKKSWIPGDDSDPNQWEVSEVLHRRGGILTHPKVVEALKRENRWVCS